MGERILREEGYEVVSVTDGDTALVRIRDFDPDLVIADISLPGKSGYDVCSEIKANRFRTYTKVVLTAGLLEPYNHEAAVAAGSDGVLRKPFEASLLLEAIGALVEAADSARNEAPVPEPETVASLPPAAPEPQPAPRIDPTLVRAAVTLAVEASLPQLIDEITEQVLSTINQPPDPPITQ